MNKIKSMVKNIKKLLFVFYPIIKLKYLIQGFLVKNKNKKRDDMFERIDIILNGKICDCVDGPHSIKNMGWNIFWDKNGEGGLSVVCDLCKTELRIPNNKLIATINKGCEDKNKNTIKKKKKAPNPHGFKIIEGEKDNGE